MEAKSLSPRVEVDQNFYRPLDLPQTLRGDHSDDRRPFLGVQALEQRLQKVIVNDPAVHLGGLECTDRCAEAADPPCGDLRDQTQLVQPLLLDSCCFPVARRCRVVHFHKPMRIDIRDADDQSMRTLENGSVARDV